MALQDTILSSVLLDHDLAFACAGEPGLQPGSHASQTPWIPHSLPCQPFLLPANIRNLFVFTSFQLLCNTFCTAPHVKCFWMTWRLLKDILRPPQKTQLHSAHEMLPLLPPLVWPQNIGVCQNQEEIILREKKKKHRLGNLKAKQRSLRNSSLKITGAEGKASLQTQQQLPGVSGHNQAVTAALREDKLRGKNGLV